MKDNNPSIIPRNHRVEEALSGAVDKGDYSLFRELLSALSNPYEYSLSQDKFTELPSSSFCSSYKTFCGT